MEMKNIPVLIQLENIPTELIVHRIIPYFDLYTFLSFSVINKKINKTVKSKQSVLNINFVYKLIDWLHKLKNNKIIKRILNITEKEYEKKMKDIHIYNEEFKNLLFNENFIQIERIYTNTIKEYYLRSIELIKKGIIKLPDLKQWKVINDICEGENNLFITGSPGTGKSFIISIIKNILDRNVVITATTGTAAVKIKGITIHSLLCLNKEENQLKKASRYNEETLKYMKVLIIDEASMLGETLFIKLLRHLEILKRFYKIKEDTDESEKVKIILLGDFYQLPPIKEKYCFLSNKWKELGFNENSYILSSNYRQNEDPGWARIINSIRNESIIPKRIINLLNKRVINDINKIPSCIYLVSTNKKSDEINLDNLNKIKKEVHIWKSDDFIYDGGSIKDFEECRLPTSIQLKVGARVMLTINKLDDHLFNGSIGTITDFDYESNSVTVKFDERELLYIVYRRKWTKKRFNTRKRKRGKTDPEKYLVTRYQIPLILAWSISIHKCQGMSLERAIIDLSNVFENGQAYVALSRIKSLNGLHLISYINEKIFKRSEDVCEFYKYLKNKG